MDALPCLDAEYLRKKWADGEDAQYTAQVSKYPSLGNQNKYTYIRHHIGVSESAIFRCMENTIQVADWQLIIVCIS